MIKPAANSRLPAISRPRWSLLETGVTWAYRSPYPPRFNGFRMEVDHLSAWWIQQGWAEIRTPEREIRAKAGEWLVASTGRRFQLASNDCVLLSVGFTCRWKFGRDLLPAESLVSFPAGGEPQLCESARALSDHVSKSFSGASSDLPRLEAPLPVHLELEALFATWLRFLLLSLQKHGASFQALALDPRVESVLHALGGDPVPEPEVLCRLAGLSRSRLDRLFVEELGETLRDALDRRRWELAQALLADPGARMKEIAGRLGFGSQQHFSRWCKQRGQATPSELRAMASGSEA